MEENQVKRLRRQEKDWEDIDPNELGLKRWSLQKFVPSPIRAFVPFHTWNLIFLGHAHILAVYGIYLGSQDSGMRFWVRVLFLTFYGYIGGIGVTAGAHRLWTHKAYKANRPLQVILMMMQTISVQYPVIKWVRDHMIHHKYTDTDADPHNAARGFWFSHMLWVLQPEHPEVLRKEKTIPMKELEDNPILDFQARHYWSLVLLTGYVIPCGILLFLYPESLFNVICRNYGRWIIGTHVAACVNSVAHIWGDKPYDKAQSAVENRILSIFTAGEAWHNYHHAFPWDYKASELPFYSFNVSTAFIDFFAWLGWATDLRTASSKMVADRVGRTGFVIQKG